MQFLFQSRCACLWTLRAHATLGARWFIPGTLSWHTWHPQFFRTAPWCSRVTSMLLVLPTCRVRFKGADHQAQTSTADFHRRVPGNFTVVAKRFLCAEHAENEIWKEDMACKIDVYLLPWPLDDKVADFTFRHSARNSPSLPENKQILLLSS